MSAPLRRGGAPPLSGRPGQPTAAKRIPSSQSQSQSLRSSTSSSLRSSDLEPSSAGPSSPKRGPSAMRAPSTASRRPTATNGASAAGDDESNIKVAVRVRGQAPGEPAPTAAILNTSGPRCSQIHVQLEPPPVSSLSSIPSSSLVTPADAPREKTYNFDNVFGPEADQGMIYQTVVTPVLQEVMSGYNCTIFAYGQTGTGKTHTMEGDLTSQVGTYSSEAGIIPRTLYRLFHQLELSYAEYSVHASFVELYNEELRDLLSPDLPAPLTSGGLKMFDDKSRGVVIQGLEDTPMRDAAHGLDLLRRGSQKRQIAATRCNESSSRSHSVFTLTVHTKETTSKGEDVLRVGKLNLVDLAGSENIGRSGAENKRAREAGMINQSLLTLGRVINALVEKSTHIPYRESKLTRLLQESLGGRTKTCIIATVSQEKANLEETLSTLDYALRAKSIRNRPEMNSRMTRAGLIMEYVKEIERLKRDVLAARSKEGFFLSNESWKEVQDESDARKNAADELRRLVEVAESKRASLQEQFEQNMQLLVKREGEYKSVKSECAAKKLELDGVIEQARSLEEALKEEVELREAYRNSERKLNRIAAGLREQAKEDESDLGGLWAKLERKAAVEATNERVVGEYRRGVEDITAQLEGKARDFEASHQDFASTLGASIEAFSQREASSLETCRQVMADRLAALQKQATKLGREHDAGHANVSTLVTAIEEARTSLEASLQSQSSSLAEEWKTFEASMSDTLASSSVNTRKALHSMAELISQMGKQTQQHVAEQGQQLEELRGEVEQAAQREVEGLKEQNAALVAMLEEERSRAAVSREALAKSIGELLLAHTEERDRSLSTAVDSLRTKSAAAEDSVATSAQSHDARLASLGKRSADHASAIEEREKQARKYRKRGEAALESGDEAVKTSLASWSQRVEACTQGTGSAMEEHEKATRQAQKEAEERASKCKEEQARRLGQIVDGVQQSHSTASEQLSSTLSALSTHQADATTLLGAHSTGASSYLSQASSALTSLRSQAQSYLTDYFARDVPTGSTPQKRDPAHAQEPPQWRLVPGVRQRALEQYRHLVAKKQQAQAGAPRPSGASDATNGTLPDDTRETVDIDGLRHEDGEDVDADEALEEELEEEEEDEVEDSLTDITAVAATGAGRDSSTGESSDETVKLGASTRRRTAVQPAQRRTASGRAALSEKNVDPNVVELVAAGDAAGKAAKGKAVPLASRRTTRAT
ncbi:kinesin-domain-containing protein [Jaminaea rosea]|uniref:Kinesin-domain-containing protein n=1 Tax=Jaminaea rosea TaxID=1569628 RepID=A0A316UQB0_9BASI|nr:kinesin-domain-containing protein [Jaminaea rosea]PWN27489.1 kinesin-domain-containing protein [Jaminaea rosea]